MSWSAWGGVWSGPPPVGGGTCAWGVGSPPPKRCSGFKCTPPRANHPRRLQAGRRSRNHRTGRNVTTSRRRFGASPVGPQPCRTRYSLEAGLCYVSLGWSAARGVYGGGRRCGKWSRHLPWVLPDRPLRRPRYIIAKFDVGEMAKVREQDRALRGCKSEVDSHSPASCDDVHVGPLA